MINFNGSLVSESDNILANNRGFLFGDGIFETVKVLNNKVLFLEDHYFRLMAGMRIVRMEIPMHFTMEFFESQILNTTGPTSASARARITIYRNAPGFYLPDNNDINFLISAKPLDNGSYTFDTSEYEIDLYKDFYISAQLLSTVKSTNRMLNITGSIYAAENGLQDCLLLNNHKNVTEALHGNVFLVMGDKLVTPPIADGCINGVMRKQVLAMAKKMEVLTVSEEAISPFDLQKADEIFITNVIRGIQPVSKYRKKEFQFETAATLSAQLNLLIRLG